MKFDIKHLKCLQIKALVKNRTNPVVKYFKELFCYCNPFFFFFFYSLRHFADVPLEACAHQYTHSKFSISVKLTTVCKNVLFKKSTVCIYDYIIAYIWSLLMIMIFLKKVLSVDGRGDI